MFTIHYSLSLAIQNIFFMKKHILIIAAILTSLTATGQKSKILSMDSLIGKKCVWVHATPFTFTDNYDGTVSVNIGAIRTDSANVPLDCTPTQDFSNVARKYNISNGSFIENDCMPVSDTWGLQHFVFPQNNGDIISIGAYSGNTAIERRDANGNLLWLKHYGSSWGGEGVNSVAIADDGGFFILTATLGNDGDVGIHYGSAFEADIWVLRVDNDGEKLWAKVIGGTERDIGTKIFASEDGGCYIIGLTASNDYDITNYKGGGDLLVAKIDSLGNLEWTKCYGGSGAEADYTSSIFAEPDGWGGFYILSRTDSDDGDVQNKTDNSPDYWLIHIDKDGNILWERNYGSTISQYPTAFCRGANGNLWLGGNGGGYPDSVMGDVLEGFGSSDAWILQVDTNGNIINQRTLGTSQQEELKGLFPFDDGTVLAVGTYFQVSPPAGKRSPGFPITCGQKNRNDVFVAHLSPETTIEINEIPHNTINWKIFPNPSDGKITIIVNGNTEPYTVNILDINGKLIYTSKVKNNKLAIDANAWARGIYTVTLSNKNKQSDTKKLTIK